MAESLKRGQVRWVNFGSPNKRRPAVILTRNSAIGYLPSVTVAEITTSIRTTPSQVRLDLEDGVPQVCAVNLYNIQTVSKNMVGPLVSVLSDSRMSAIEEALLFALDMGRYIQE